MRTHIPDDVARSINQLITIRRKKMAKSSNV